MWILVINSDDCCEVFTGEGEKSLIGEIFEHVQDFMIETGNEEVLEFDDADDIVKEYNHACRQAGMLFCRLHIHRDENFAKVAK